MSTIGAGAREIRVRGEDGAYRVFYVVVSAEAVYVLHAFQKKSQKTLKADIDKGRARYQLVKSRSK